VKGGTKEIDDFNTKFLIYHLAASANIVGKIWVERREKEEKRKREEKRFVDGYSLVALEGCTRKREREREREKSSGASYGTLPNRSFAEQVLFASCLSTTLLLRRLPFNPKAFT